MSYTEDTLVQQTTADYLEQQLGWESVYAYNNEDIGPGSLLGRASDRDVVLTRPLHEKLVALNPGLPGAVYDDAVRQITATVASQTLAATNREKNAQIRDGVQVTFCNDQGERMRQRLRVFDFDTPANNHFLCVRELWVRGDLYRRRADIIGFVNGLPLLFIECKNLHKNLKTAFEQNFSDYRDTIPHLFHHNAIVMFGNGEQAKIGSITSRWEHFNERKRLAEEAPGAVDMETLLKGVCDKRNFLDLVENFILFDESAGEPKKIIARNHQFLGVNRAINSVRERKARQGKLGVFWHTQGSGKTYSMVMFTHKVHRKLGGNFTFLVFTDRDDLDTQIYKTFANCGVVSDQEPCRAASGHHLNVLLTQHKAYVFSLIQKFNQKVEPEQPYSERDDIIVITDETHRTQYGTLALNLRNALPDASYIGFTGTPLFKDDEITRRVFGEYVSTYDFQRAVEDKATIPLYYDASGEKLGVAIGDLNERIAEKLEELETDDIDVEQQLERELKRDYHTLMQAIARANRVNEGKNNGLIVDYCGNLKHLRKALATFAGTQPEGEGGETDPARPDEELLADLAEAIALVRTFLEDRDAALDDVIQKTGFERNAVIVACKEAANENDESHKRFEVMCREVFKKFKACINVQGVNTQWADRDAINIVYKSLQQDRENADITDIIRQLHRVVDEAIDVQPNWQAEEAVPYDVSKIDFDRLCHTGLPVDVVTEDDVNERAEDVFRHVYRAYPSLPSPFYSSATV